MKENDRKRDAQGVSGGGSTFTQRVLKKSNWPTQNFQFKGMKWDFMFKALEEFQSGISISISLIVKFDYYI